MIWGKEKRDKFQAQLPSLEIMLAEYMSLDKFDFSNPDSKGWVRGPHGGLYGHSSIDSTTNCFVVKTLENTVHCFGCDVTGSIFEFVKDALDLNKDDDDGAAKDICKRFPEAKMPTGDFKLTKEQHAKMQARLEVENRKRRRIGILNHAKDYFHSHLVTPDSRGRKLNGKVLSGRDLWHGRGATDQAIEDQKLGYVGKDFTGLPKYLRSKGYSNDEIVDSRICKRSKNGNVICVFINRLVVPIYESVGNVGSFVGRDSTGDEFQTDGEGNVINDNKGNPLKVLKYQNLTGDLLMFDSTHIYPCSDKVVLIPEGNIDAVMLADYFKTDFRVISGRSNKLTNGHIEGISTQYVNMVLENGIGLQIKFIPDADKEGQKGALRTADKLYKAIYNKLKMREEARAAKDALKVKQGKLKEKEAYKAKSHEQITLLCPSIHVVLLQQLPKSYRDKPDKKYKVDVADYLQHNRGGELEACISSAIPLENFRKYLHPTNSKNPQPDDHYAFVGKKYNVDILATVMMSEGRYYAMLGTEDKPKLHRLVDGIFVKDSGKKSLTKKEADKELGLFSLPYRKEQLILHLEDKAYMTNDESHPLYKKIDPPHLIAFLNGVLNWDKFIATPHDKLHEFELDDFSPFEILTRRIPANFDLTQPFDRIIDFLAFMMASETDAQTMLECAGYIFYPSAKMQKIVTIIGASNSGKSTWMKILVKILSFKLISAITMKQMEKNNFSASDMIGKLANISADEPLQILPDPSLVKKISGSDVIQTEAKFESSVVTLLETLCWLSAENWHKVKDATPGYFRRLIGPRVYGAIPEMKVKDQNELVDYIHEQVDGIVTLFCFNYRLVEHRTPKRFTESQASKDEIERYRKGNDWFQQFASDCITEAPTNYVKTTDVRDIWRDWFLFNINDGDQEKQNDPRNRPPSARKLNEKLQELYPKVKKTRTHFYGLECSLPPEMAVSDANVDNVSMVDSDTHKQKALEHYENLEKYSNEYSKWKEKWVNINNCLDWIEWKYGDNNNPDTDTDTDTDLYPEHITVVNENEDVSSNYEATSASNNGEGDTSVDLTNTDNWLYDDEAEAERYSYITDDKNKSTHSE